MSAVSRRFSGTWPSPAPPLEISAGILLSAFVGLVAIVAVALGAPRLTSVIPTHVPVAAHTGLCFVLLAVALHGAYQGRRTAAIPAALVMTMATVTALQFVTGRDVAFDRWLFGAPPGASEMSPQTALAFALLSAAILAARTSYGVPIVRMACVTVLVVSSVNLLDVLYDADQPTILAGYTQMALPTAVTFLMLALGVLALRPDGSLLELVRRRDSAGVLSRRLLVAAVLIPVAVGWLQLNAERAGWYESAFGVTLMTLTTILLFTVAVRVTARTIQRSEAGRERAEEEREQARAEAEAANRAKSEFLSRMSHELRTPLNSVLGFAQLLEADELTADQRDSVAYVRRAGQHLLQLINEVLDISRIDSGTLSISVEAVAVHESLEEVSSFMSPMAAAREIDISIEPAGACTHFVLADRQRLRQVLLNLLSNAVKYNRQGGTIRITCQEITQQQLRINVTDTGPGIPLASQARLFEPFDRLGAEATGVEGTGMGLALSKALVEAMRGQIGVESVPGSGSTFWIAFPTTAPPDQSLRDAISPPAATTLFETPVDVLYIEDNPANLRLVERILERIPRIRLVTALQGRIGLELAHDHRPALVLLDLHLPDMDGGEVLRRLRADPTTAETPVVILTADGSARDTRALLAEGANAYLTKPLDVEEFVRIVEQQLLVATDSSDR